MKKELYDLTVGEFVKLLSGEEDIYKLELKCFSSNEELEKDEITGTYDEVCDTLNELILKYPENKELKLKLDEFNSSCFDYKTTISELDAYDYLEYKTKGFEKYRTQIILRAMSDFHGAFIYGKLDFMHEKQGIKCKYRVEENEEGMLQIIYEGREEMRYTLFDPCYEAIKILRDKLGDGEPLPSFLNEKFKYNKPLSPSKPKELSTDEARKWLQVAINGGLLNADYSTTDKTRTKPQKALLAEILSDKIGLAHKYKPFETLWNVSGLSKSRYKSKEEKGIVKGGNIIIEVFEGK